MQERVEPGLPEVTLDEGAQGAGFAVRQGHPDVARGDDQGVPVNRERRLLRVGWDELRVQDGLVGVAVVHG